MYGYVDDAPKRASMVFGLNQNVFMTKFEYNPQLEVFGSKQEALDIEFNVNGAIKNYPILPITKVTNWDTNEEITDPNHKLFQAEVSNLISRVIHLMKCFAPKDDIMAALSTPESTFKGFCQAMKNLLPKNFDDVELHLFTNWQWNMGSNADKTYLQIPKKTKHGAFFCTALEGEWQELKIVVNVDDNGDRETGEHFTLAGEGQYDIEVDKGNTILNLPKGKIRFKSNIGLTYVKEVEGGYELHPFSRTGWFLESKFGYQQKDEEDSSDW